MSSWVELEIQGDVWNHGWSNIAAVYEFWITFLMSTNFARYLVSLQEYIHRQWVLQWRSDVTINDWTIIKHVNIYPVIINLSASCTNDERHLPIPSVLQRNILPFDEHLKLRIFSILNVDLKECRTLCCNFVVHWFVNCIESRVTRWYKKTFPKIFWKLFWF